MADFRGELNSYHAFLFIPIPLMHGIDKDIAWLPVGTRLSTLANAGGFGTGFLKGLVLPLTGADCTSD